MGSSDHSRTGSVCRNCASTDDAEHTRPQDSQTRLSSSMATLASPPGSTRVDPSASDPELSYASHRGRAVGLLCAD